MNEDFPTHVNGKPIDELFKPAPEYIADYNMQVGLDLDRFGQVRPLALGPMTQHGQRVEDRMHLTRVVVDQGESRLTIGKDNSAELSSVPKDMSVRGSIVYVEMVGEDGSHCAIRVRFHKGQTYIGVEYADDFADEDDVAPWLDEHEFWRD
jgi:hypothetical protein